MSIIVHSLSDLVSKAELALGDNRLVKIAIMADTPSSAKTTAKRNNFGRSKRDAVHALARIKRDHGDDFWNLPQVTHVLFNIMNDMERKTILAKLPDEFRKAFGHRGQIERHNDNT